MKNKGPVLFLLLLATALGVTLIIVSKNATDQKQDAANTIALASNKVISLTKQRDELETANQTLQTNMAAAEADFSNKMTLTEASLEKAVSEAKAEAKAHALALSQREQQISDLESRNQALDKEGALLRTQLTNLEPQIAATQEKLAKAEGNRALLLKELKDLQSEKASLQQAVSEAKTEAKAQAEAKAVLLAQRDQKISDLESLNQALDTQAALLRASIANLDPRIAARQEKLAKSQGDREFLLKELKFLRAEKQDLENKFNSLAQVREQLHKLRAEAAISQRLDWMRRGIYTSFSEKGGERLAHPLAPAPPPASLGANVELMEGGGLRIQTSHLTNAPAK